MNIDRTLTLHFNDGSKLSFDFPQQAANTAARDIKLAEFLTGKHLVVEAEGSLLIFPVVNIKYIAFNGLTTAQGKPVALPKHAITGARII